MKKFLISAICSLAFFPAISNADTLAFSSTPQKTRQDILACKAQPEIPWCAPQTAVIDTSSDKENLEIIQKTMENTWEHFHFQADPEYNDKDSAEDIWKSSADVVSKGKYFWGDCDRLVFTAFQLLIENGIPRSRLYRYIVDHGDPEAHMIGLYKTDSGQFLIIVDSVKSEENTLLSKYSYKGLFISPVSDGISWYKVTK